MAVVARAVADGDRRLEVWHRPSGYDQGVAPVIERVDAVVVEHAADPAVLRPLAFRDRGRGDDAHRLLAEPVAEPAAPRLGRRAVEEASVVLRGDAVQKAVGDHERVV